MKKLFTKWIKTLSLLVLVMSFSVANAQVQNFKITVENLAQTATNKLEFDVYLLDTDPAQGFELASCQLGFLFNSLIYTGGTVSVAIDNTGSGLNGLQQFTAIPNMVNPVAGYPNQTLIRLAGRTPPGSGNGTIISTSAPGTLLTHFTITSSVNFTANSTPNLIFNSSSVTNPLYPTRVSEYISNTNTPLTVTSGTNALVCCNPVLNPPLPIAYNVTGSGSYCQGGSGLPVGVANSETGVTYTLFKNTIAQVPTVNGTTGSPITFGNQLFGTYTVSGTNSTGTTVMNSSAVITENANPTASVLSLTGPSCICNGSSSAIKVDITGGTSPYSVVYHYGTTDVTVNSYVSGSNIVVTPAATTTYTLVSVTDFNGCLSTGLSGSANVVVATLPVLSGLPTGSALGCNPVTLPLCDAGVTASNECGPVTPVTCTPGTVISNGCNRSQDFTYSATACGLTASSVVTYTWTLVTAPVLAGLPAGGDLGCNPAALPSCDPGVTASNECGTVTPVTCTPGTVISNGCNRSQDFTYSATACGLTTTTVVTYTWTVASAPVLAGLPAGGALGCNPAALPSCDPGVTASNECGPVNVICTPGTVISNGCNHSQDFTYSATACGLTASSVVTYTWTIATAPVLAGLPAGGDLGCNPAALPSCDPGVTASNECGTVTPVTCTPGTVISNGCNRSQDFTYSATACGLTTTTVVTYTWTVASAPVLAGLPAGGDLGCNPAPPACDPGVTASNECGLVTVICTPGTLLSNGCNRSQDFTYSATACERGMHLGG